MLAGLLSLLVATPLAAETASGVEAGQQLVYRGTVSPCADGGAGEQSRQQKTFELTWFVAAADASGAKLYWLVAERGRGAWPWVERFGVVSLDCAGESAGAAGPSLFYDYGEGESIVPLPLPVVARANASGRGQVDASRPESRSSGPAAGGRTRRLAGARQQQLWRQADHVARQNHAANARDERARLHEQGDRICAAIELASLERPETSATRGNRRGAGRAAGIACEAAPAAAIGRRGVDDRATGHAQRGTPPLGKARRRRAAGVTGRGGAA